MGGVERAALNAAFARHVAAKLGPQAAYEPAEQCPQGHRDYYASGIGGLCPSCVDDHAADLYESTGSVDRMMTFRRDAHQNATEASWHPEWRIGPGAPQDFCGSLDRTVADLAALGLWWEVDRNRVRVLPAGRWTQVVVVDIPDVLDEPHSAPMIATALIRAALRVLGEVTPDARDTGPAATRARD
jgi:hypothetical protein